MEKDMNIAVATPAAQEPNALSLEEARQTVSALQQALQRKDETIRRRHSELALINRVAQVFNSTRDLDHILITVLEEVRRLLEVDACSIWLRDEETDQLVCEYAIGPYSQTVRGWRLASGQGIAGMVARTGESLIVPNALSDERHFRGVEKQTGQSLQSILTVPLKVKQEIIGVLQVLDTQIDRFNETDQILQELLATVAAMAIENARLHEKIWQDADTKTLLVHDVNLRGKLNLTLFGELLSFAKYQAELRAETDPQTCLTQLAQQAHTLTTVHSLLAESEWNPFSLSELSSRVIQSSLKLLASDTKLYVAVPASQVFVSSKYANYLALVIHELVSNSVAHATKNRSKGHILVHITQMDHTIHFEFRDDGPGYSEEVLQFSQQKAGLSLIQNIVRQHLRGTLTVYNDNGAVAMIRFKVKNGIS